MKKCIVFLVVACVCVPLFAQTGSLKKAGDYYAQKNYEAAIQEYEMIRQKQGVSAELYYNLGNAYYRSGQTGKSILNYNRALMLAPNYSDAQFNLRIAQRKIVDNVDATSSFFLVEWASDFGNLLTSNGWAITAAILFAIAMCTLLLFVFNRKIILRKLFFNMAVVCLIISLISVIYAFKQSNRIENSSDGIIMAGSVTAKDSPSLTGKDVFVLHEGTKVTMRKEVSGWTEIELPDGNAGFIPATDIEKI